MYDALINTGRAGGLSHRSIRISNRVVNCYKHSIFRVLCNFLPCSLATALCMRLLCPFSVCSIFHVIGTVAPLQVLRSVIFLVFVLMINKWEHFRIWNKSSCNKSVNEEMRIYASLTQHYPPISIGFLKSKRYMLFSSVFIGQSFHSPLVRYLIVWISFYWFPKFVFFHTQI